MVLLSLPVEMRRLLLPATLEHIRILWLSLPQPVTSPRLYIPITVLVRQSLLRVVIRTTTTIMWMIPTGSVRSDVSFRHFRLMSAKAVTVIWKELPWHVRMSQELPHSAFRWQPRSAGISRLTNSEPFSMRQLHRLTAI